MDVFVMEQKFNMIIEMMNDLKDDFKSFCADNTKAHEEIIRRQDATNGSIAKLKRSQLVLRGVGVGVIITLVILGFMPERLWEIFKAIF